MIVISDLERKIHGIESKLGERRFGDIHSYYADKKYDRVDADYKARRKLRVISVFGGKGGVGKSTIAINLAAALSMFVDPETYKAAQGSPRNVLVELVKADPKYKDLFKQVQLIKDTLRSGIPQEVTLIDLDLDKANVLTDITPENLEYYDAKESRWVTYRENNPNCKNFNQYLKAVIDAHKKTTEEDRRTALAAISLKDYRYRVKGTYNFYVAPTCKSMNPDLQFKPDQLPQYVIEKICQDTTEMNSHLVLDNPAGAPLASLHILHILSNKLNYITIPTLVTQPVDAALEDGFSFITDLFWHYLERKAVEYKITKETLDQAKREFFTTPRKITVDGVVQEILPDFTTFRHRMETSEIETMRWFRKFLHGKGDVRSMYLSAVIEEIIQQFDAGIIMNHAKIPMAGETDPEKLEKAPERVYDKLARLLTRDMDIKSKYLGPVSHNPKILEAAEKGVSKTYGVNPNDKFSEQVTLLLRSILANVDSGSDIDEARQRVNGFAEYKPEFNDRFTEYRELRRQLYLEQRKLKIVSRVL